MAMQDNPNPYSPPVAPVDPAVEPTTPRSLRTLLRALIVLELAALPLLLLMPERLPPDLQATRDKYDAILVTAYPAFTMLSLVVSYASLIGLWWEKRWAAWAFVVSSIGGYALQLMAGPRIMSDVVALLDSVTDVGVGAIFVILYMMGTFSAYEGAAAERIASGNDRAA